MIHLSDSMYRTIQKANILNKFRVNSTFQGQAEINKERRLGNFYHLIVRHIREVSILLRLITFFVFVQKFKSSKSL